MRRWRGGNPALPLSVPGTVNTQHLPAHLHALLAAECAAEAAGTAADADDLCQAVNLRWLEQVRTAGPPAAPAAWVRARRAPNTSASRT